jgi:hypothetical protein
MKNILVPCSIILFLFLALHCSKDPDATGSGLVSPQDTITIRSSGTFASGDTTFLDRINGGSTLIGYSSGIESRAFLQFSGFSNIPSNAPVDSAVIQIPINYWFRDSGGTMAFSAYALNTGWTASALTWSLADSTTLRDSVVGSFLGVLQNTDTVMRFHIDALARYWVANGVYAPNGLILIPSTISTDVIAGTRPSLYSDTRPSVVVYYRDTTADTTVPWQALSLQEGFVANSTPVVTPGTMLIQSGVAYRSVLRFDSIAIPPNVSITRATLRMVRDIDPSHSVTNPQTRDSLIAYLSMKNVMPFDSLSLGSICSPSDSAGYHVYTADVRTIVQQWIIRRPNYGFVIRPFSESVTFDRFSLYGTTAPAGLRPTLTITYTVLP